MTTPNTLIVILAGGFSSRMGKPKALLSYCGKPQFLHLLDLAAELQLPAVVSCRTEQINDFSIAELLTDSPEFQGHGPVSGLLSAHKQFPHSNLLLLGCDYPLLTSAHLQPLLYPFSQEISAVCWRKEGAPKPEPMPALYRVQAITEIHSQFQQGFYSLSEFLSHKTVYCLSADADAAFLKSVDTPEEYQMLVNTNN